MKKQEHKKYYFNKIYPVVLGFFASTIVFREFSSYLLGLIFIVALFFYKDIKFTRAKSIEFFLISIPLLLQIMFFWNNEELYEPIKELEKYTAFLALPIIIVFFKPKLNSLKILHYFSFFFTTIIVLGTVKYLISNYDMLQNYIQGDLVWMMGYAISNSLGLHAPALNLHISFLCFINLYLFVSSLTEKTTMLLKIKRAFLLVLSIVVLLMINTRIAVIAFLLGLLLYLGFLTLYKNQSFKRNIIIVFSIIFVLTIFLKIFPYTIEKFTLKTFNNIDMIGQIDQIENPEEKIYGSLVTRITVWQITLNLASSNLAYGYGVSDAHPKLFSAYEKMNQKFLAKHQYKVHNQYLDFLLKFGVLGIILTMIFFLNILRIGIELRSSYALYFFFLFAFANITDDFLIRYDGIVFSAFWISLFVKQKLDTSSYITTQNPLYEKN